MKGQMMKEAAHGHSFGLWLGISGTAHPMPMLREIIQTESHRTVGVGRDHWKSSPMPLLELN